MTDGFKRTSNWQGRQVLVLSPTPSHPQDYGNRKRINTVCKKLLSFGATVDFAHYPAEAEWRSGIPANSENKMVHAWNRYYVIPPSVPLHSNPTGDHHEIDSWWDPAIETFLRWLFDKRRYDVFIVNYTWLSRALTFAPKGTLRILDTHDRFAGRKELLLRRGVSPEFFYLRDDAEEAYGLNRADLVWAIKREEAEEFRKYCGKPVLALPHIDDGQVLPPPVADPDGFLRVGFIGANNNVNRVNLGKFLESAIPAFKSAFAPVKLVIAGGVSEVVRGLQDPLVQVVGRVSDVEDFYKSVDVVAIPMEFSTGLKIKTGEALSMGLPIVATAHAFEGFESKHPYHRLRGYGEVADAIIKLAFDSSQLHGLRYSTLATRHTTLASIDEALESSIAIGQSLRPEIFFLVDGRGLQDNDLYAAAVISMLNFLAFVSCCRLYVVSGTVAQSKLLTEVIDRVGTVYVGPSVYIHQNVNSTERNRIVRMDFEELAFRNKPRFAVLDSLSPDTAVLEKLGCPVAVRCDQVGLLLDRSGLLKGLAESAPAMLLSSQENATLRAIALELGAAFLICPNMHGKVSLIEEMAPLSRAGYRGVAILGDPASDVAAALQSILPKLGIPTLYVDDSTSSPASRPAPENPLLRCLSKNEFLSHFYEHGAALPRIVVDTTEQKGNLALLSEFLLRLGIPHIQSRSIANYLEQPDRCGAVDETLGSFEAILRVREFMDSSDDRVLTAEAARIQKSFAGNGGWAALWSAVGSAIASESGQAVLALEDFGVL